MGSRTKETLRNLATLAIGILVAIGIAEGALRLIKGTSQVTRSR